MKSYLSDARLPKFKSAYHKLMAGHLIGEATFIYPLYSIMFSERSHISAAGVGFLLAAWQITQIFAEVPTGVLADKFSKKYSILAGRILKALALSVWFLAPSFGGYLFGFIIWGIGDAFISGATQAYLYELNDGKKDNSYLKSYSHLKSLEMFVYATTFFCTFLIGPRYQLLVGLSILTVIISSLLAASLPVSKVIASLSFNNILLSAKKNLQVSRALRIKFFEGLAIAGTLGMLVEYLVVNYHQFGASSKVVPALVALITLLTAGIYWLLHRYVEFFRSKMLVLLVLFGGMYVLMFYQSMWWQMLGLFFVTRYMRVVAIVQEASLLDDIEESSRATVLSGYSLMSRLLSAMQIFLVSIFAINNNITHPTMWFTVGSLVIFAILKIFFDKRKQATVAVAA